jgi:MFS family permease
VAACALMWWKGAAERASPGAPEPFLGAMRTGLRFARHAPELRRTLLRAASFFVFASAYWALLPLIARRELGGDASLYGLLLASVGAGAVGGAIALPRLRQRIDAEATLRAGVALTVVALGVLATAKAAWLAVMALLLSGASWIAVLTTANTAAQTVLPNWVRGRGLAVYLTVFYGAMTLGGLLWGGLADATSVRTALWSAAALGAVSLALAWWRPLPDAEPDVTPSLHWPEPALHVGAGAEDGPVLIAIDYEVAAGDRQDFLTALAMLSAERRRNGALRWDVFEDAERLGRFTELFLEPSWAEHIRHHARVTRADADVQAAVQRFHRGVAPPVVRHLLLRHS